MSSTVITLARTENQVRSLAQYALDFLAGKIGEPSEAVLQATERFQLDAVACGVSALALGTNAPAVLRREALEYPRAAGKQGGGVPCFGSRATVAPEKAVVANSAAVREWDSNGTNFGYDPARGHTAGEFGHNDFYPVAVAAAQRAGFDGPQTLRAMLLIDEIRGRLAEVFSLKTYKIDRYRLGDRLRCGPRRDGRANRVGRRHDGRPLHSVPRDPGRQATLRLEGLVGCDQFGSRRAQHVPRDARVHRAGRHLP